MKETKKLIEIFEGNSWKFSDYAKDISDFDGDFNYYTKSDLLELFEAAEIDINLDSLWAIEKEKNGEKIIIVGDGELNCPSARIVIFKVV